jgi:hypothetical protein
VDQRTKRTSDGLSRRCLTIGLSGLLALASSPNAIAATIVAPSAQASVEGNLDNLFPFGITGLSSQRYEQVYRATEFGSGPLLITGLAFRPDAFTGAAFSTTLSNVSIFLTTTTNAPDALSSTFANNEGADKTLVHSGSLSLSSADTGPAGGPKAFDIVINLTTPFLYNPGSGNLLLEVQNFGGGTTTFFDAQITSGDSVSRVFTLDVNGANDAIGNTDTLGLVTEFLTAQIAVPEPSSIILFGSAALMFAAMRRRKQA